MKKEINFKIPALQSYKITPQIIRKLNYVDEENKSKNNISSLSRSSFKTSKINEESSEESSSQKSDKSSSEFDINKSVHTSRDYSSQKKDQSSQASNYSLLQLRGEQRRSEEIKISNKRKTTASSKENKQFLKRQLQSILYINEENGEESPDSPMKSKRFSIVSSAMSFSSKATEKVNKEGTDKKDELQESKVSKKFSEQTTKRVVFLVLLVVMSEYIFQLSTYISYK